jgi:hypothetical protein
LVWNENPGTPSRTPNAFPIVAICLWVMIAFALPFSTSGNALIEQSPSIYFQGPQDLETAVSLVITMPQM